MGVKGNLPTGKKMVKSAKIAVPLSTFWYRKIGLGEVFRVFQSCSWAVDALRLPPLAGYR